MPSIRFFKLLVHIQASRLASYLHLHRIHSWFDWSIYSLRRTRIYV